MLESEADFIDAGTDASGDIVIGDNGLVNFTSAARVIDIFTTDPNIGGDDDITTGGNDHVYAYFGQRRGGNVVYAFDVTDPDGNVICFGESRD